MSSKTNDSNNGDTKKVYSIAKSINLQNTGRLLVEFLSMDFLLVLVISVLSLYCIEVKSFGSIKLLLRRAFYYEEGLLFYRVGDAQNPILNLDITIWVYAFVCGFSFILFCQIIKVFSQLFGGAKRISRKLEPLNEMARQAKRLSEMDFDEEKYHDLENAISNLKVDRPDAYVRMNNSELDGLEQAVNGLIDRMKASYKMQTQFVSDASHELRTPIAVIQGYVNMLDRWGKNDEAILEESIEAIKNEAGHMQTLIEQLLFLARGDSNRQKMDKVSFCLNDVLREVYEESLMIDEQHVFGFKEFGNANIVGDIAMIKQSARILIDNARKYTPVSEDIQIRVGVTEDNKAFYEIQDDGIGMKQEDLEHIFDRFYRADAVRNSQTGGTGLGLSIAKWIVDQHDGFYQVVSRDGIGTRFTVFFNNEGVSEE